MIKTIDPDSGGDGLHETAYALIDFKLKVAQCVKSARRLTTEQLARIKDEMWDYIRIPSTPFNAWNSRDESIPDEDLSKLVDTENWEG